MIVSARATVPVERGAEFLTAAAAAVTEFTRARGCLRGRLGRAADDPQEWVLVTEWDSIGAYRRALSSAAVQFAVLPISGYLHDEPTAFETLFAAGDTPDRFSASDRAGDPVVRTDDEPHATPAPPNR